MSSSDPDWALYRTFLRVATLGSLSAAARSLGLTQPTIARHIDSLESAVGAALFLRTPRGLLPTELARSLLPQAEAINASAAALLRTATTTKGAMTGTVRICAGEIVSVERLPAILATLRYTHPGLEIELTVSNKVQNLLDREADIAVRQTAPTQGALLAKKLAASKLGLFAHRTYVDRKGRPHHLEDLPQHDLIGLEKHNPGMRSLVRRFPILRKANFALRTDNDLAQTAAVRAGVGIGVMHCDIAARDPSLIRILSDQISDTLPLWVVMHQDLRTNRVCRAVFDALASGLSIAR